MKRWVNEVNHSPGRLERERNRLVKITTPMVTALWVVCLVCPLVAHGEDEADTSVSPDKHFELVSTAIKPPKGQSDVIWYQLRLKDKVKGDERLVTKWTRSIDIVWSPDSRHFAVNFNWGSDLSDCRIFPTHGRIVGVNPYDIIVATLGKVTEMKSSDVHRYFLVDEWLDNDRISTSLVGHWDTKPKTFRYEWAITLSGRAKLLFHGPND